MKLIIDCDPGNGIPGANVDDSIALTYCFRKSLLEIKAIWTVFGNTHAAVGYQAAQQLICDLNIANHIPLRTGSSQPLAGKAAYWRERLDISRSDPIIKNLWGSDTTTHIASNPTSADLDNANLKLLANDLTNCGTGVIIVALGPLTNIARLITNYPHVMSGVDHIVAMGGAIGFNDLVDTNFAIDPVAANIVLNSDIPITLVPLDVTRTTVLSKTVWQQIAADAKNHTLLNKIRSWLEPWLNYSMLTRPVDGTWLHDLVVPIALTKPELVTTELTNVTLSNQPAGKLIINPKGHEINLVTSVNNDELVREWATTVFG